MIMIFMRFLSKVLENRRKQRIRKYVDIGDSVDIGIKVRSDDPIKGKCVSIGDRSIVGASFNFESSKGFCNIGNNTFVGGGGKFHM